MCLAVAACASDWKPLAAPIEPAHRVGSGVRIAVAAADAAQLEDLIAVLAGKQLDLAAAATPIAATEHQLSAIAGQLPLGPVAVAWAPDGKLLATATLGKANLALAIGKLGGPACAVAWPIKSGTAQASVAAQVGLGGGVAVVLSEPTASTLTLGAVADSDQCLQGLPVGTKEFVDQQVRQAVHAAWAPLLGAAALKVVRALVPASLVVSGSGPVTGAIAPAAAVRISMAYGQEPGPSVFAAQAGFATAGLQFAIDADRHPCAPDVAPPKVVTAAALAPTASPTAKAVLRRALVVDHAALQHTVWALARAGAWCRQSRWPLAAGVPAGWASATAPALAKWADDAPPVARLWPHTDVEVDLADSPAGPVLQWQFADASLEIVGSVGGVPATLLVLRGHIRGTMRPIITAGTQLTWLPESGSAQSAVVTSPLAGGTVAANAEPLGKLVAAAIEAIFTPAPVLPLAAVLPAGTVATSVTRAGNALWLWLDGGLAQP